MARSDPGGSLTLEPLETKNMTVPVNNPICSSY
jgi:hypothetical protein